MRELFKRVFKKEEGFSLIELIIVIAILAIIAAIAVPNLLGNIGRANESTDISNAKLIADSISTAIALNPELEGKVITKQVFDTPGADVNADTTSIFNASIKVLNSSIPTIKSNKNGTVGDKFEVELATEGLIKVYGSDGTSILFPQ